MTIEATPLSIEQAVSALASQPEPADAAAETTEAEQQPTAEVEPEEVEASEPAEEADPPEEEAQEPEEVIDAPLSWDAEAKALFEQLPVEARKVIAEREKARDNATQQALQRAAEERKRYEAEASGITSLKTTLDQTLARAEEVFKGEDWETIDWPRWIETDPQAAMAAKLRYDQQREDLQRLRAAQQAAEEAEHAVFLRNEQQKLPQIAPELIDPQKGPELQAKVARFLIENNIAKPDDLRWMTAEQAALALDALRYRELKANAKSAPTKQPPARPPVKPVAAQQASPKQRKLSELDQRLSRTGSIEDAVALLRARK